MIDVRFVPMERWPQEPTRSRKKSPFGVSYLKALDDLESELKHLGAREVVIQADLDRDQIRNDGWPLASARFKGPAIILSFVNRQKQEISFPCDTYGDWQSNLRAISLTLTALRAIDRYGVTKHNEQYKGWAKLPPAPEKMKPGDALAFVSLHWGAPVTEENWPVAYRTVGRKLHPDNLQTGNNEQFLLLQQARDVVKEAYRWQ